MPKHIANVLIKVFVREFYRMNSGFMLLMATLAFGFMSAVEHIALAQFFTSSYGKLSIPVSLWLTYALKILAFNNRQMRTAGMGFVFNIQFLPASQQFALSGLTFSLQFLPALCYGMFLVAIAYRIKAFESVITVLTVLTAVCFMFSLVIMVNMRNPCRDHHISVITRYFDRHYVRTAIQFYTEGLLRQHVAMIGGTKLFTGILTFAVCMLYRQEHYDGRLLAMTFTACGVANALIISRLVVFEHTHMMWMKNMPITAWKRYARLLLVICLIVAPEAIVLIRNYPPHLEMASILIDVLYMISLGAFFLGYFYLRLASLEIYTRRVFWIFLILVVLILFNVPLLVFIIFNIVFGYLLFTRSYYTLEMPE